MEASDTRDKHAIENAQPNVSIDPDNHNNILQSRDSDALAARRRRLAILMGNNDPRSPLEEHVENQFNSDLKINLLRTALETFITNEYKTSSLEPVYETVPIADNELPMATHKDVPKKYKQATRKKVGWKVPDKHIQQVHDIVELFGADAIHSRGMYGETILHQVCAGF